MLAEDGRVIFLDFGLMSAVDDDIMEAFARGIQACLAEDWVTICMYHLYVCMYVPYVCTGTIGLPRRGLGNHVYAHMYVWVWLHLASLGFTWLHLASLGLIR